jgi:hypothetical protein
MMGLFAPDRNWRGSAWLIYMDLLRYGCLRLASQRWTQSGAGGANRILGVLSPLTGQELGSRP